jgi:hypothetical protein
MSEELLPIIWIRNHPYLIVNYDIDNPPQQAECYLLLRPLGPLECESVKQAEKERMLGTWAELIWNEENRWKVGE